MNADRMHSDPNLHDISIGWDDEADGSDGGYDRHGNFVIPSAMKEIVRLRAEVLMLKDQLQTQAKAAKMGMDAARHSAQVMRDQAARLFAQCSHQQDEQQQAEPLARDMTLRDWYAGQALQGLLSGSHEYEDDREASLDAEWHADRMMEQRAKRMKASGQ